MAHYFLDVRRLLCPLPVIRTQDRVKKLLPADILEVVGTDPGMLHDIPSWCRIHGHEIIEICDNGTEMKVSLRVKGGESPIIYTHST